MFLLLHLRRVRRRADLDRLLGRRRLAHAARSPPWRCWRGPWCCCRCFGASGVERATRRIIAWFGPRGLSSLLLVLLPVFAGRARERTALRDHLPGGAAVGGAARRRDRDLPPVNGERDGAVPDASAGPAAVSQRSAATSRHRISRIQAPERITIAELRPLQEAGAPVILADVRTERSFPADNLHRARARSAFRLTTRCDELASGASTTTPPLCSTVRERTKPQAPGWRESFERQDGPRPEPW